MNKNLPEYVGMKDAAAGARCHAGSSDRVGFLVTATAGATITLTQHNAATAGASKPLATDNLSYFKAVGATAFVVDRPVELAFDENRTIAGAGLFYIEVESSQLDTNGGFTHVSITGATGAVIAFAIDARHGNAYNVAF